MLHYLRGGGAVNSLLCAFTLAEVLITLGIIGIVAAMTLPALIGNYQKKQTAIQLKKIYSIMQQALQRAEVDYEAVEYWDFTIDETAFSDKYIKPYYKILTDYKNATFPTEYHIYCRDGRICDGYGTFQLSSKFVIADGTLLAFHHAPIDGSSGIFTIIIDINGFKKPNQYGRDIFMFAAEPSKGMLPYGLGTITGVPDLNEYHSRDYLLNGELRSCNQDGILCAAVIMMDGWEIKDDYTW